MFVDERKVRGDGGDDVSPIERISRMDKALKIKERDDWMRHVMELNNTQMAREKQLLAHLCEMEQVC